MSIQDYRDIERQQLIEDNINLKADNEAFKKDIVELVQSMQIMQSLITEQNKTIQKLMTRVKL